VRAYANITDELEAAGYSGADIARIRQQLDHYLKLREIIRKASGESLDVKAYEADMRHLIDTYIQAEEPRKISPFDDMPLLELIVKTGIAEAVAQQLGALQGNKNAVAETIENNVRRTIIKEHLHDPAYYEKMSALLDEIIAARKAKAIEYEDYLRRIAALAKHVEAGQADDTPEALKQSPALRALYNNLKQHGAKPEGPGGIAEERTAYTASGDPVLHLALRIDATVKQVRPDDWRGVEPRERVIKRALFGILQDVAEVERIFLIIKAQKEY
jgi:type I restriction enzyme R subunit